MEKKVKSSKRKKRAAERAHPDDRRVIRRRLVGAVAILALTLLFWEFGSTLPPQRVVSEAPSVETVFQQREESALSALAPKKLPELDLPALIKEEEDIIEETEAEEEEVVDDWIIGEKKEGAGVAAVAPQLSDVIEEEKEEAAATPQSAESSEPTEPAEAKEEKKEAEKPAPAPAPQAAAEESVAKDPPPPPPKKDPPPAKENTSGQDNYHVQVGAFGELLRAKETAGYIEGEGYAVSLLPLEREGAPLLWQVRATGYPTRAAAEKAQQQLAPLGYPKAQIVKVDAAVAPKPKTEAAPAREKAKARADAKGASPRYTLRVGAFRKGGNKDRAIAAMKKIGANASEEAVTKDGVELIRVFIADIATREDAKRLQKALEREGYKNTVIEKAP